MSEMILLQMENITKQFPGVKALDSVNLRVKKQHIHALVGENGAGKSTLMNILSGIYKHGTYDGEIYFDGELCQFKGIRDSEAMGIVIIHQELALVPQLSIAENVFLGNERLLAKGVIDWASCYRETDRLLQMVGLNIECRTRIQDIGVGKQQLIEIAKALSKNVKLLILDEPTAALNDEEANKLLELLMQLREQGITSIIISHKLDEIQKVADEITIIRDGTVVETLKKGMDEISEDRMIKAMVGRDLSQRFPERTPQIDPSSTFEVKNWTVYDEVESSRVKLNDINLKICKGEVVGIAGLMGSGRTELCKSMFGQSYGRVCTGQMFLEGKEVKSTSPAQAIKHGLAYVTEDRKTEGLMLQHAIVMNMTLSNLSQVGNGRTINQKLEIRSAEQLRDEFHIKAPNLLAAVGDLSGGNQQKVNLAKWVFAQPSVLMLDEPTRGIDIGAKYEVYTIINRLAAQGKYVLVVSSEMAELLGICDRIYVLNEGRVVGELSGKDATQEAIMSCIIQSTKENGTCPI